MAVDTDYPLDTLSQECFVLFNALCFICENSDNAPSKSSGVYAGGSHVLHRCDSRAIAGCYKTKLRYSDCWFVYV